MDVTSLAALASVTKVEHKTDGIAMAVPREWIVENESRVSYTGIVRLAECCREYHWQKDILPLVADGAVDSIARSVTANFSKPIEVGSELVVRYSVCESRRTGYKLRMDLLERGNEAAKAQVFVELAFVHPTLLRPRRAPILVRQWLASQAPPISAPSTRVFGLAKRVLASFRGRATADIDAALSKAAME